MKITNITTSRFKIPLKQPFTTALRTTTAIDDVIVSIDTDSGLVGYGAAPATPAITGETHQSIETAILHYIKPALTGLAIADFEVLQQKLHSAMAANYSAKAAVDIALYDLLAKSQQKPLYELLGGQPKTLQSDITISVNSIDNMVQQSLNALKQGFKILKIKVGMDTSQDLERIKAIANAVGNDIQLRIDANQAWSPKEAVKIIQALEDLSINLDLIEQPVKAHDIDGMKYVHDRVNTPILADESVFSAHDAIHVLKINAADLINIKLMKTGGIYAALKLIAVAKQFNTECMMGCMLEGPIGVIASAHLAVAKATIITRVDLDPLMLCTRNPMPEAIVFNGGDISLSKQWGLGISLKND